MNRFSSLPKDPEWFRRTAAQLAEPAPIQALPGRFSRRAVEDVLYTFHSVISAWRFPKYRTHRPWHQLVEYRAGARRFPFKIQARRRSAESVKSLLAEPGNYFLFPLQLHSDAQIRFHSPFGDMAQAIRTVVASFALHAPDDARLVLTEHPLDNGVIDLEAVARSTAGLLGVSERVSFIGGGSPCELIRGARGVITVNSTIGIAALGMGRPVAVLGDAIYALPGLACDGPLQDFWTHPLAPDPALYAAFHRVVLQLTQINGGFYSVEGRRLAVEGSARRLEGGLAAITTASPLAGVDSSRVSGLVARDA